MTVSMTNAVRAYLSMLVRSKRHSKTALADAMGTSRAHFNTMLASGRITTKHIDGLSVLMKAPVSAVLSEIEFYVKRLETGEELILDMPGDDAPRLPGEEDREALLNGELEPPAESPEDQPSAPPVRPQRRRRARPGTSSR